MSDAFWFSVSMDVNRPTECVCYGEQMFLSVFSIDSLYSYIIYYAGSYVSHQF